MRAVTEGFATTESEVRGFAVSRMRGTSRGVSESAGEGEVFVTTYACLPTATYSLEEQLHRLAGELASLPRRQCFVKIENERPFRTRTADLTPAFRSPFFQRIMLPVFRHAVCARSPYLLPVREADRAIAARVKELIAPQPEPDFTAAEPMPPDPVHDAPGFARDFWKRREKPQPPADPPGRPPKLCPDSPFRVLDGGKAPDGDNDP
jgi:hypothetical protein